MIATEGSGAMRSSTVRSSRKVNVFGMSDQADSRNAPALCGKESAPAELYNQMPAQADLQVGPAELYSQMPAQLDL